MRRVALAAMSAAAYLLVTATSAFADSSLPRPDDPLAGGTVVTPPGGTAFTGGDVMLLLAVAATLLAIGIGLVVAGKRRAASSA